MKEMALIALVLSAQVGAMEMQLEELDTSYNLQVRSNQTVTIKLEEASYIRGNVKSNELLASTWIQNASGQISKHLITTPTKEVEVFWYAKTPGQYQLSFKTVHHQPANVAIELKKLALKENQYLSPKSEITSPTVRMLATQLESNAQYAENNFWKLVSQRGGTPLIEYLDHRKALLTFLYRGEADNVRVLGSPYGGHDHLTQLNNSTVWYKTYEVPSDTRLSYRIAANVPQLIDNKSREQKRAVLATSDVDALNYHPAFGKTSNLWGEASSVTLRNAEGGWVTEPTKVAKGKVTDIQHQTAPDQLVRKVSIYRPNSLYKVSPSAPLLILFDGEAYLNQVPTPTILDNLIAQKLIPPLHAVFINPPLPSMRAKELTPNADYGQFLANEFMPWLCNEQSICPSPDHTILSGSSFGGLASMFIAISHPERFGKVLSQSGSFWWRPKNQMQSPPAAKSWMEQQLLNSEKVGIQVYLNAGVFEVEPKPNSIVKTNRQLFETLQSLGYNVSYREVSSGHDYFSWRVMLADGLITLFNNHTK